jgi:polyhydroxyalkanoate synthesis regulator phasin
MVPGKKGEIMESNKSINSIIIKYQKWLNEIMECNGEVPQSMQDMLNDAGVELAEKLDKVAGTVRYLKSQVDYFKKEEQRLQEKRKSIEKGIDSLRESAEKALIDTGQKKLKTKDNTFSFRDYVSIHINEEELDLSDFLDLVNKNMARNEKHFDKAKIKALYKDKEKPSWYVETKKTFIVMN